MPRPVDVEGGLQSWLRARHADVPVVLRVPPVRPAKFVRLYRIGGVRINPAQERALLNIEAWGTGDLDAFNLAAEVWSDLDDAGGQEVAPGVWVDESGDGLASPVENSDPETGQARYQFTANLVVSLNLEVSA